MKSLPMKILLTGKNGQVGFELRRALSVLGELVTVGSADCDFSDVQAVRALVDHHKPGVIVNPAAYTAVDKAQKEQDLAFAVNAKAPEVLAIQAQKLGALLVHYSTDYVFDGSKPDPYVETDVTNPQGVYGASKLAGEKAIMANCERHLILRTSWVVGAHGGNFAKTMLRLAAERDELSVVADQFGAPTSAALLADITAHLVSQYWMRRCLATVAGDDVGGSVSTATGLAGVRENQFPFGTYHLVASGSTNWHEYACYVIERARQAGHAIRVSPDKVRAISTDQFPTPAKRPKNSRLDTTKLRSAFGLQLPSWQSGVDHILNQIL